MCSSAPSRASIEIQRVSLATILSDNLPHSQRPLSVVLSCLDYCSTLFLSCQVQVLFLVVSFMSQCKLIRVDNALKRRIVEVGILRPRGLICASKCKCYASSNGSSRSAMDGTALPVEHG